MNGTFMRRQKFKGRRKMGGENRHCQASSDFSLAVATAFVEEADEGTRMDSLLAGDGGLRRQWSVVEEAELCMCWGGMKATDRVVAVHGEFFGRVSLFFAPPIEFVGTSLERWFFLSLWFL